MPRTMTSGTLGVLLPTVILAVGVGAGCACAADIVWDFEDVPVGGLPARWQIAGTNQHGLPATWQVVEDKTAPGGDHVLALTSTNHHSGSTFNLCWTDSIAFGDGEITVDFKARTGREDQGGGIIWRVQDADNYYIARFNPLEDNFCLYKVHRGVRRTLASIGIALAAGKWHTMRITQHGPRFVGFLDGKKLLEGADDTFTRPGGVGLWTKADAATSFAAFTVRPVVTPKEDRP